MDDFDKSRFEEEASKEAVGYFAKVAEMRKELPPADFALWHLGHCVRTLEGLRKIAAPAIIMKSQKELYAKLLAEALRLNP